MAKTKQTRKKIFTQPMVSVEDQLAQALAEKPHAKAAKEAEARMPNVGDRVMLGNSQNVFTITRANPNSKDVDLQLPGTAIERFRVPVEDLKFVDEGPQASRSSKPAKPKINVEEIRERIATAQHSSVEQFSGDIAVLKKYLKSKDIEASALEELDSLCEAMEKRWSAAVEAIEEMLEE